MIEIPSRPRRTIGRKTPHGSLPCILCGQPCRHSNRAYVHVHKGGRMIVSEAEAEQLNATPEGEAGEMGLHPIGPGCLQAHPEIRPYVQWQVKKRPEAEGKLLPPNQKGADV